MDVTLNISCKSSLVSFNTISLSIRMTLVDNKTLKPLVLVGVLIFKSLNLCNNYKAQKQYKIFWITLYYLKHAIYNDKAGTSNYSVMRYLLLSIVIFTAVKNHSILHFHSYFDAVFCNFRG